MIRDRQTVAKAMRRGLSRAPESQWRGCQLRVTADALDLVWQMSPHASATFWMARSGESMATSGIAHRVKATGANRFFFVRRQVEKVSRALASPGRGPAWTWVGGFAFAPGQGWPGFGDALATLPRWRFWQASGQAFLSCILAPGESADEAASEFLGGEALQEGADPSLALRMAGARVLQLPQARWSRWVEAALAAIGAEQFEKVVLARVAHVQGARAFDVARVLAHLRARASEGTVFAFREPAGVFMGVTPERLVRQVGRHLTTEALAGTRPAGTAARVLQRSAKDGREHKVVRDEILESLRGLGATARAGRTAVRRSGAVMHLHTPIDATAPRGTHVLDAVAALHPTPAVAGRPARSAMKWLGAREAEARGWYAGPVGWFDARGNGEFVVALRSAYLQGARARVYSGAGIVTGSDAAAEYEETAWKQRGMLAALGVRE